MRYAAGIVTVWVWHYLRADTAYLCSSVVDFKKEENVMSQELEQETAKNEDSDGYFRFGRYTVKYD